MNYLNDLQLRDAYLLCSSYFFLIIHTENTSKIARIARIVSYGGIVSGKHTIIS